MILYNPKPENDDEVLRLLDLIAVGLLSVASMLWQ
jgi:hypothetical protein